MISYDHLNFSIDCMKRILLTISYDGTNYHGFQLQPGLPTIEGELNHSLTILLGTDTRVKGASRTDAGVHASGNVAVFDSSASIPAAGYPFALLKFLPDDIRVLSAQEVSSDFDPRKSDSIKTYEYTYSCGPIENPLSRRFTCFSKFVPAVSPMEKGAAYLIGEHDFTSFANPSSQIIKNGQSAVRNIYSIDIKMMQGGAGKLVKIVIRANGFLYNMVRIIAGTLMNVGRGLWTPEKVLDILRARDRTAAGPTAEARGLRLVEIKFI